ncbi:MAG TPA: tRNA epoxyqueuosine(34) reductase QueG [Ktedonobacteraceae bacterium]|nr:tRNA epoxyqueuosine(34) reductase QueG [Ktedonobacteraceae bacterium]
MLDTRTIKEQAYALGFDTVRITSAEAFPEVKRVIKERIAQGLMDGLPWFTAERADVSCHPDALLPEARSIIALGMTYLTKQPEEALATEQQSASQEYGMAHQPGPRGRIARYAWGDDYHEIIKPKLQQFASWLQEYAHTELDNGLESRLFVDTGRIVDRAVAQRAGLGWYGKNTNILTKGWGSWLFLAEIVTNLVLAEDEAVKTNCGACEICLHACPTNALPNAYELDNRRCISYLTIELRGSIPLELRPLMGDFIFGCDICQEVCPVNKVAEQRLGLRGQPAGQIIAPTQVSRRKACTQAENESTKLFQPHQEFQARPAIGSSPELIPLLSLTEEQFRERFRHSAIKRTKRRGLLRNVCVALGNSGDRQAVPALSRALHDEEPLIRGHAAWALGRLAGSEALSALQAASTTEEDEEVRDEIRYALATLNKKA